MASYETVAVEGGNIVFIFPRFVVPFDRGDLVCLQHTRSPLSKGTTNHGKTNTIPPCFSSESRGTIRKKCNSRTIYFIGNILDSCLLSPQHLIERSTNIRCWKIFADLRSV